MTPPKFDPDLSVIRQLPGGGRIDRFMDYLLAASVVALAIVWLIGGSL